ncbi:MAG: hypothetical protein ABEH40_08230 [Haloferacaceae archaeon]
MAGTDDGNGDGDGNADGGVIGRRGLLRAAGEAVVGGIVAEGAVRLAGGIGERFGGRAGHGAAFADLFGFAERSIITVGPRSAGEINALDRLTLIRLRHALERVVDDPTVEELEARLTLADLADRLSDIATYNLCTTTGPLGSRLTAISMGYDPDDPRLDPGEGLPFVFDLQPTPELEGCSLDEIAELSVELDHPNWRIRRPDGAPLTPEPTTPIPGTDRMRYRREFATVVVKRHPLDEARTRGKRHLVLAGCHRDGTYALGQSLFGGRLLDDLHDRYRTAGRPERFQAVAEFHIDTDEYVRRRGTHVPGAFDVAVAAFERLD